MPEDPQTIIPEVASAAHNPLNVLLALFEQLKKHSDALAEYTLKAEIEAKRVKQLSERDIPDMMNDLGLQEFKMRDGTVIRVKDEVFASVSKERMPAVVQWLKEHNMAGIAKEQIVLAQTGDLKDRLIEHGIEHQIEHTIHPATLKAFAKERVLAESDPNNTIQFPRELFSVTVVPKASLVRGQQ